MSQEIPNNIRQIGDFWDLNSLSQTIETIFVPTMAKIYYLFGDPEP